jgi:hypothetical protein
MKTTVDLRQFRFFTNLNNSEFCNEKDILKYLTEMERTNPCSEFIAIQGPGSGYTIYAKKSPELLISAITLHSFPTEMEQEKKLHTALNEIERLRNTIEKIKGSKSARMERILKESQKDHEKYTHRLSTRNRYYVVIVWQDVEPEISKPFGTMEERDAESKRLRTKDIEENGDEISGIYWIDQEIDNPLKIGAYSGIFFEGCNPFEEIIG